MDSQRNREYSSERLPQRGGKIWLGFARMMSTLFAKRGLICRSSRCALHKLMRRFLLLCAQTNKGAEMGAAMLEQNKRVEKLVTTASESHRTLDTLFATVEGEKRVAWCGAIRDFLKGTQEFSASQLASEIESRPEIVRPNALLSPVRYKILASNRRVMYRRPGGNSLLRTEPCSI